MAAAKPAAKKAPSTRRRAVKPAAPVAAVASAAPVEPVAPVEQHAVVTRPVLKLYMRRLTLAFVIVFSSTAWGVEKIYEQARALAAQNDRIANLVVGNQGVVNQEAQLAKVAGTFIRTDCAYIAGNRARARTYFRKLADLDERAAKTAGPNQAVWAGLAAIYRARERDLVGDLCHPKAGKPPFRLDALPTPGGSAHE